MKSDTDYLAKIASYYKHSQWLYQHFWYSPKSLGLHYGFADKFTKSEEEASLNQYRYVIAEGKIKKGMSILDAGCGVGGGSIYIAKQTGARVTGVSITSEQIALAKRYAGQNQVSDLTQFLVADYAKTGLPAASLDLVFAIESACHAYPKKLFLDEAYRILKPKGKLIIADGYSKRKPKNREEEKILADFCRGFYLKELIIFKAMTQAVSRANFKVLKVEDKTEAVGWSLRRMEKILDKNRPLIFLSKYIPLPFCRAVSDNALSMRMSIEGIKCGLFGYFCHVAVKK